VTFSAGNYYLAIRIYSSKARKALFLTGVILNLGQIIILNYASFAIDPLLDFFQSNFRVAPISKIIIPLGISYYTLQALGYLVNIKMGWEKPERNFPDFLLYIIFYPKFISGPVERSNHFLPQLKATKSFSESRLYEGLRMILLGAFKKVVIANQLGVFVNNAYSDLDLYGGLNLWVVLLIQPLYLYFDFSGYTDIALGIAKTYGIDLLPNFKRPFLSENVTSFWKRFHMSLSFWFNDYIFKQTSFKYRKWGKYASVFAVVVTFTLFGIWHGAGWNFMVLGLMQAVAINYEFFTKRLRTKLFSRLPVQIRLWVGRFCTYLFYAVSLTFFFSPSLTTSFKYFSGLSKLDYTHWNIGVPASTMLISFVVLSIFMIAEIINNDFNKISERLEDFWNHNRWFKFILYYLGIFLIFYYSGGKQEFIYSQF